MRAAALTRVPEPEPVPEVIGSVARDLLSGCSCERRALVGFRGVGSGCWVALVAGQAAHLSLVGLAALSSLPWESSHAHAEVSMQERLSGHVSLPLT